MSERMLALIPARGGSRGIPGKNIRPFAGLPLIGHSIKLAQRCARVNRLVVSTDSSEIAQIARDLGAEAPFVRPPDIARDDTPMWPVVRHALASVEKDEGQSYDYVVLLDPTTPCRKIDDIEGAFQKLSKNTGADGIIAVSEPHFNPIWHSVVEREGWMEDLIPEGALYHRRQDAPVVYRINGAIYIWRASFVRRSIQGWRGHGRHLIYEVPDLAAISIDTIEEFELAEYLVLSGKYPMPWIKDHQKASKVQGLKSKVENRKKAPEIIKRRDEND
ncbi:MAG: acylneuraminate cytidylyltransferase family protein [Elusimicrobia bacterium]|nr:acylneuraminate cytidylyltransferase family protein [Elusimicrobiota bacterium]